MAIFLSPSSSSFLSIPTLSALYLSVVFGVLNSKRSINLLAPENKKTDQISIASGSTGWPGSQPVGFLLLVSLIEYEETSSTLYASSLTNYLFS